MLSLVLRMAKEEDPKITEEIKVLANLYKDLVQVIVRKDLEIDGLKDLQGMTRLPWSQGQRHENRRRDAVAGDGSGPRECHCRKFES